MSLDNGMIVKITILFYYVAVVKYKLLIRDISLEKSKVNADYNQIVQIICK